MFSHSRLKTISALQLQLGLHLKVRCSILIRTVSATLEKASAFDFKVNLVGSEELERFLIKVMFASRQEATEEIHKPTNILTLISKIAKIRGQEWIRSRYETLSEIVHPNFMSRSLYVSMAEFRNDIEMRTVSPAQLNVSREVVEAIVSLMSWAVATHVTSFGQLQKQLTAFAKRVGFVKDQ